MKIFSLLLFLCVSSFSFAQQNSPVGSPHPSDSILVRRQLPPSMLAELRRTQKARTIVFKDTISAEDLTKLHFNDSLERQYTDSAISLYDTAVSLPHQEWLDSELFEIPELARFGSRVHFDYPPSIMTETYQLSVPFDSTLLLHMDHVTREHLPFFDQSPIPMPLERPRANESFIEAGAGNVDLPELEGWFSQSLSDRTTLNGIAEYRSLDKFKSAIQDYGNVSASLDAQLGADPSIQTFHSQDLKVSAGYNAKSVALGNISGIDKTISQFSGAALFSGEASEQLYYDANLSGNEFSDNITNDGTESDLTADLSGRYSFQNDRTIVEATYSLSALNLDTTGGGQFFGTSSSILPISSESIKALFGRQENNLEWYAGAEYLGGDGTGGASYTQVLPVARFRVGLDERWSLGGSFEPQVQLASLSDLTNTNPFYSSGQIMTSKQNGESLQPAIDGRSVVMDKFNLAAFLQYFVTADDEFRFDARYVERARDAVFGEEAIKDSGEVFTLTPEDTRTLSFSASGNFLLFARDVLSASAEYASVTTSDGHTVPFVPNFKFDATYHLNSVWENFRPSFTFRSISRPGETFNFLDAEVDIILTHSLEVILDAENILGGASDFWPGYPECPQSIIASLKYSF